MPHETIARDAASGARVALTPHVLFAPGAPGGTLTVHPAFAELFARVGLRNASAFLDLPGEVVSGHPDRHVVQVELPGAARVFYLKRQHAVGWPEKLRNRRAGFGWLSRCEREAILLRQLEEAKLPGPRWAAFGTHGTRAFLLVEEVPGAIDLRQLLGENGLSPAERRTLNANIGQAIAAVHAAGFTTPDLTAKHVLVNPESLAVTFLDWQSSVRTGRVSDSERADALGALNASLAEALATPHERLQVLRSYRDAYAAGSEGGPLAPRAVRSQPPSEISPKSLSRKRNRSRSERTTLILRAARRHAQRRSVRDQLHPTRSAQRLVWLAGEAVCAVPEVAAVWPRPAIAPPFYGFGPDGTSTVRFAKRDAILVRGRTSAPLGRLRALFRATPWRSPGVTIGRVLFHLERYGVPAPRLLAFGQRLVSATGAEWFALYESPPGVLLRRWRRTAPSELRRALLPSLTECLQKLHDSGCVLADAKAAFAVSGGRALLADPRAVRIVRRVSDSARRRDLRNVTRLLGVE